MKDFDYGPTGQDNGGDTLSCAGLFNDTVSGTEASPPSEPIALGLNYRAPTLGI